MNPLDQELMAAIVTTELRLGKDRHAMNYIHASRKGLFDPPAK